MTSIDDIDTARRGGSHPRLIVRRSAPDIVDVDGAVPADMAVRLAFEVMGEGRPVVILHDLLGSGDESVALAEPLARSHRVLLPDARNHGDSPWTRSMSYCAMAEDLESLITQERLHRPILVGHGMGGKTAMVLALTQPQAIAALVVIDSVPSLGAASYHDTLAALCDIELGTTCSPSDLRAMLVTRLGPGAPVDLLLRNVRRQGDRLDWRFNLPGIRSATEDLIGFPRAPDRWRYDGPTLFLNSDGSDVRGPEMSTRIAELFPAASLRSLLDYHPWPSTHPYAASRRAVIDWLSNAATK